MRILIVTERPESKGQLPLVVLASINTDTSEVRITPGFPLSQFAHHMEAGIQILQPHIVNGFIACPTTDLANSPSENTNQRFLPSQQITPVPQKLTPLRSPSKPSQLESETQSEGTETIVGSQS
jgi:hypothetical protein